MEKTCTSCGASLPRRALFCPACGTRVEARTEVLRSAPPEQPASARVAGVVAGARATAGHLLGRARWLVEVVRLRTRLLVLWTLHRVESRRLLRRRSALFARLGEAVYRGDGARGAEARAELDGIEQRLSEQRQRLGREIEETLRREREAELASRRTGVIRLPAQAPETATERSPAAPEQPPVTEPSPPPGEADPPRIPEPEGRSSEAPTLEDAARRSPGRRRADGARQQMEQSKPSARRRSG
ncbi:MAG: zinc-ribbon domain-containing protein [Gaiellaceae bacterium]